MLLDITLTISKFNNEQNHDLENGIVSIGNSDSLYRRLCNVAGGIDAHDAANIAQLDYINNDLNTKIATNKDNIDSNSSNINTNTNNIKINSQSIEVNKDNITLNSSNIQKNTQNINANKQNIDSNSSNIKKHHTQINNNTIEIENLKKNNQKLADNINNNSNNIQKLNTKLEKGLAITTAISGIEFIPIEKGEVAIGAAVSTYHEKQAIAIGIQGAPSENFRINSKIGVVPTKNTEFAGSIGASWKFKCY